MHLALKFKTVALGRLINRFGAYLSHLVALTENTSSTRSVHRQKVIGYILKWQEAKVLIGCSFFHDLLKAPANLCKALQEDGLEAVMKTVKALDHIKSTSFEELPTLKLVLGRIKREGDSSIYIPRAGIQKVQVRLGIYQVPLQ